MRKWIEQMVLYVFLQKYSGLRTTKLSFGISSFLPEQTGCVFSSIFYLAFAFSFSAYLLILFK
jgi:hypothetical protein